LANIFLSLLDQDDEVIVLAPYWVSYSEIIKLAEGKTVLLKAGIESDFKVSAEDLEKAITPKTKALLFSSPCNPTGSVYLESELKAILEIAREAYQFFLSENIEQIGKLLKMAWEEKQQISPLISTHKINQIIEEIKGTGAYGWKLLGAGGCGFILVICNSITKKILYDKFNDSILDFKFENEGTSVIHAETNI
jgi:aspartate aminotransferase